MINVCMIDDRFACKLQKNIDRFSLETLTNFVGRDEWVVAHMTRISAPYNDICMHITEDISDNGFLDIVFLIDSWNIFDALIGYDDSCTEHLHPAGPCVSHYRYQRRINIIKKLKYFGVWDDLFDIRKPATFVKEFVL